MSRSRNIKPGFFRNADLVELPVETRLLFIGLWTMADREGRLADRPKQIKMELYPADGFDVDAMLGQLHDSGFIKRYESNKIKCIQITNFLKHQNPHHAEKPSPIPAPDKPETSPGLNVLIPDSRFLIPEPGSRQQQGATTPGPPKPEPEPPAEPERTPAAREQTPPSGENPPAAVPIADAITTRAVGIAVLLRQRGAGVVAGDPRLRSWAERGITDAALLAALQLAEHRRTASASLHPVNAGLLDAILADAPAKPASASPPARASPHGKHAARERYAEQAAEAGRRMGLDENGGNDERNRERDITGESSVVA
jgi:hypothetical protein